MYHPLNNDVPQSGFSPTVPINSATNHAVPSVPHPHSASPPALPHPHSASPHVHGAAAVDSVTLFHSPGSVRTYHSQAPFHLPSDASSLTYSTPKMSGSLVLTFLGSPVLGPSPHYSPNPFQNNTFVSIGSPDYSALTQSRSPHPLRPPPQYPHALIPPPPLHFLTQTSAGVFTSSFS